MKKIISEVSDFISANKVLLWILIVSICIFTSYNLTMDKQELFTGAEFIYNLSSQLSLAYMGSFIFYVVQVYIPNKKRRDLLKDNIEIDIYELMDSLRDPIADLCSCYLEEDYSLKNITNNQWDTIRERLNIKHSVFINFKVGNVSFYEAFRIYDRNTRGIINRLNLLYGQDLDAETVKLLGEILNSSFHRELKNIDEIYPNEIYVSIITNYHKLYIKLHEYVNKKYK